MMAYWPAAMPPAEIVARILLGLILIGLLQAASAFLANEVRRQTIEPANAAARQAARNLSR